MAANLKPHSHHPDGDPNFAGWQPTPIPAPAAESVRVRTWQYVALGFAATSIMLACVIAAATILSTRSGDEPTASNEPVAVTIDDNERAPEPTGTTPPVTTAPDTMPTTIAPEDPTPDETVPPTSTPEDGDAAETPDSKDSNQPDDNTPPDDTPPDDDDEPDPDDPPDDSPTETREQPSAQAVLALNAASLNLAELTNRGTPPTTTFDRQDYGSWIDADNDCQTTRNEVLFRDSEVPVDLDATGCIVVAGSWVDMFSGTAMLAAIDTSVTHIVPLAEVHAAGGADWTPETKQQYANDLTHPGALAVTTLSTSAVKGDRTPDEWMPENDTAVCGYTIDWISVKFHWGLSVTDSERDALAEGLTRCSNDALLSLDLSRLVVDTQPIDQPAAKSDAAE